MKSNHLFLRIKSHGLMISTAMLLFSACINGYKDDQTFSTDVRGETLESPKAEDIVFKPSPDGKKITVQWPVVHGAGGYQFSLYIVDNPEKPIIVGEENEVVDGCSVGRELLEDTKYKAVVKTLGNAEYNNKDAAAASENGYSSLLTATIIPKGVDLTDYFSKNPIPESTDELAYELEAGGNYTISGLVDFGLHRITIRGNKQDYSTVTYGINGRISTMAGLKIKFIDFDCNAIPSTASDASFLLLNKIPDESLKNKEGFYVINDPVLIQSCIIKGVNKHLFFDNGQKYCTNMLLVKDCIVELNSKDQIIRPGTGLINDLTISNSTWSNINPSTSMNFFIQYANGVDPQKAGFASGSVNFNNNTFYNIARGKKWCNYGGMNKGHVTLNVTQNIFVDCSSGSVLEGVVLSSMIKYYKDNSYWFAGTFPAKEITYDMTGTHIESDPLLKNPSSGDFTVGGADQIAKSVGDPRWLPSVE